MFISKKLNTSSTYSVQTNLFNIREGYFPKKKMLEKVGCLLGNFLSALATILKMSCCVFNDVACLCQKNYLFNTHGKCTQRC